MTLGSYSGDTSGISDVGEGVGIEQDQVGNATLSN
jgi:hypothetical protein